MKQALPHSPAEGPSGTSGELAGLPSSCLPKGGTAFLPTCGPTPSTGPGSHDAADRQQIGLFKDWPNVPPGASPGSSRIHEGEYFVFFFFEHTNSLEIRRRHQRAGLARFPVSKVLCPLLPALQSPGSLGLTSLRTAFLPEAASGVVHSSWKPGQA